MTTTFIGLAQTDQLTEVQRAVRDHFQEGGSFAGVLAALAIVFLIVLTAWWLTRRSERSRDASLQPDSAALFDEVIDRLAIDQTGARLLNEMAQRADLKHPTVLLLSRDLFDQSAAACNRSPSGAVYPERTHAIEQLRRDLFGKQIHEQQAAAR